MKKGSNGNFSNTFGGGGSRLLYSKINKEPKEDIKRSSGFIPLLIVCGTLLATAVVVLLIIFL